MKLRVDGRLYDPASPAELSLRDLINLERVTTELGMPVNLGIIEQRETELREIRAKYATKAERDRITGQQPWAQMLFAVNVYAARRKAGDDVTFDDCLDLSPVDVAFIQEAGDEEPDPTVPPRPLKASAAAVKRPQDKHPKAPAKKSKATSTAG